MSKKYSTCSFADCERGTATDLCLVHRAQREKGCALRPITKRNVRRRLCTVDGCDRKHASKGYCSAHYLARKQGRPIGPLATDPIALRFPPLVEEAGPDECWRWLGGHNADGYGRISSRGREYMAHRLAYERDVEAIPPGLVIDHTCRDRGCMNPAHMEPVTNKVNVLRGFGLSAMNARKTHCKRGHEFSEVNTIRSGGSRSCRTCANDQRRARRARKMAEACL